MTKQSIPQTTEDRITYLKERIAETLQDVGKAYVEGKEDHIPYLQMHLNAWKDELRELEEAEVEARPFAVFETKEEYDKHCKLMMAAGVDDVLQKVVDEVKRYVKHYWESEKILRDRGRSIYALNTKANDALISYSTVLAIFGVKLDWSRDSKDSESRIYQVVGIRLDDYSVVFCLSDFGKDEWWQ